VINRDDHTGGRQPVAGVAVAIAQQAVQQRHAIMTESFRVLQHIGAARIQIGRASLGQIEAQGAPHPLQFTSYHRRHPSKVLKMSIQQISGFFPRSQNLARFPAIAGVDQEKGVEGAIFCTSCAFR
jgi:hypothetical protein